LLVLTQQTAVSKCVEGTLMDMPFGDAEFDIVLSVGTSMHVPSIDTLFSEIYRVLKKNGIAVISMANKMSLYVQWTTRINRRLVRHQQLYHRRQFTYRQFKHLLVDKGFAVLDAAGFATICPISLKENWKNNIITPRTSKVLSFPLDQAVGKYLGCAITFILRKR
jgi:ubiquinone/menaquinone biosynthesis C-methylase UbiE